MQNTDREEFNAQMRKLCGGLDVFPSADKVEAYWTGLEKMSLPQFVRIVNFALSEEGPEKMPNVPQVWAMYRDMRRSGPNAVQDAPPGDKPVGTIAEQLCTYAVMRHRFSAAERSRTWEYRYREW